MLGRVVLQPGGSRLPDYRGTGQEAGAAALLVNSKISGDDDIEQRLERSGQRAHYPGYENRGVAGCTVLPDSSDGLGGKPAQNVRRQGCIDEALSAARSAPR